VFFIDTAYAIHGDTYVPHKPVSHGCVRIPMALAAFFHTLVPTPGRPVYIRSAALLIVTRRAVCVPGGGVPVFVPRC